MQTIQLENISKEELENIKAKMYFFDIAEGFIGKDKSKVELFLRPCSKATDLITLTQLHQALDKYNEGELK